MLLNIILNITVFFMSVLETLYKEIRQLFRITRFKGLIIVSFITSCWLTYFVQMPVTWDIIIGLTIILTPVLFVPYILIVNYFNL